MSDTLRRIVLVLLVLLLTGGAAAGQTTQPAPTPTPAPAVPALQAPDDVEPAAEWPVVVRKFAETLVSPAGSMVNSTAIRPAVMKDCTVRRFDGGGMMLSDLTDRTAGALLVSARGYVAPVSTMASDIAEDASTCKPLPDDIKGALMPADVDAMRRANATAARWVASILDVDAGQPVGVVVQWCVEQPDPMPGVKPEGRLLIVLLKGQLGTDGKYRVRQIVYGNTKQATQ